MDELIDEYKSEVTENRENFKKLAPFAITKELEAENNKKAFDLIQQYQRECKNLRQQEEDMQFGLEIFNMEPTNYVDLALVEKENASLLNIWSIKQEWDHEWDRWKVMNFKDVDTRDMEERASEVLFKAEGLTKEEKKWKVYDVINERIYTFMNTLPLINALRDESMRDRHWKELRIEVKEDFDEESPEFTMERVF